MNDRSLKLAASPAAIFLAPHRALFLSGGVALLAAFAAWWLVLSGRAGWAPGWAGPAQMPAGWWHAWVSTVLVLPFFIFGFLLTAMPRWQGQPEVPAAAWQPAWGLLAGGWLLAGSGLIWPAVLPLGMALVLAGWGRMLWILGGVAFARAPEHLHARIAWGGLAGGALAVVSWGLYFVLGEPVWARAAIALATWGFLLPVFLTVCHRMIPFFSASVVPHYVMVRPRGLLLAMLAAGVLHGGLAMADQGAWSWPADLALAGGAAWLSWRWRPRAALRVPLLGMLHIGFAWLSLAMALYTLQGMAAVAGHAWLGLAPLHALTIGYFGSLLFAMVSRVTLGHSGRPLQADALLWRLFLAVQAVAVARVLADLLPPAWSAALMLGAVSLWLVVFVVWAWRFLPIYCRPRADGRPG